MSLSDRPWGGFYRDTGINCPHCQQETLTSHGGRLDSCPSCGHVFIEGVDLMKARDPRKRKRTGG